MTRGSRYCCLVALGAFCGMGHFTTFLLRYLSCSKHITIINHGTTKICLARGNSIQGFADSLRLMKFN